MTWLLLAGLGAYVLAAALGGQRPTARLGTPLALAGGVLCGALGVGAFLGAGLRVLVRFGPPGMHVGLRVTPLSALFLVLISAVGILASVYGSAYVAHLPGPKRRSVQTFAPLFLLSMTLVALAADLVAFLMAWELMSLTSYALVMTDRERPEVVRAGYIYLLMTHVGATCLLAAFLLLTNATGSMAFSVWAHAAPTLPPGLRSVVFLLVLAGFGSKAALVPLHVWLPRAHPVAPSHISGLMSGVMLKVAIYGLVLIGFGVLGPGPLWWGLLVAGLGGLSSVLGVLYALMEHDLKRLLAFHSVENVGIIAMGLGVALIAQHARLPLVAAVALVAALYHTINHALFKTALFLNAGAVQFAGAGRNLDAMGGLLPRMPWTAVSLLAAAASISGLPPFNGFISEWLTYQSLVRLAGQGPRLLALCAFAGVLALALTGGLAAACFVKAGGVSLLGRPRSEAAARAREVPAAMHVPGLILAAACLALGLLPAWVVGPLSRVAASVLRLGPGVMPSAAVRLSLPWAGAHVAPLAFGAGALLAVGGITALVVASRRTGPGPEVRPPWACGGTLALQSQYSATAYAKPFRQVFGVIYRPVRSVRVETTVHPFFQSRVAYEGNITHVFDRYVYAPLIAGVVALSRQGRRLQSGSLRLYLGYILATLVLLLALAR